MSTPRPPISPALVLVVGIFAVSTSSVMIRFAQSEASSIAIATARLSIATLILLPIAVFRHNSELRHIGKRTLLLAGCSGVFLAIHFASWISSLSYTSVTSSIVIVSTLPLWVALLSPWLLREPIRSTVIVGLLIALFGTFLIALVDACMISSVFSCPGWADLFGARAFVGDLLALTGALSGAGYMLLGRSLRSHLSIIPYITLVYGAAALALIGLFIGTHQSFAGFSTQTYAWLVLLALIPQLLGHSSFNYALGYLPAAFVSITILGEPIGTILLAYLILGEAPGTGRSLGAILILIGIFVAVRKQAAG